MTDVEIKAQPKLELVKEEIPHILEPGEIGAILELTVRDKGGKVTEKRALKSKSFVRQFLELLWVAFQNLDYRSGRWCADVYGGYACVRADRRLWSAGGGIGETSRGILVGAGTNAPTINDYTIQTLIPHGTGPGQLQYSAVTFGAPSSDATTSQFTVTRNFANGSGAQVTVYELTLVVQSYADSYIQYYHMVIRDVIPGGIAVPNGQTLTVNYRIQVTI